MANQVPDPPYTPGFGRRPPVVAGRDAPLAQASPLPNFSDADNRRWRDQGTQEWQETTTYLDVVAWGTLGEHVARSLHKGDRVTVTGRLDQRSWESGEGERRSKLELAASDVAASLRWATVAVTKLDKPDPTDHDDGS
jgi:single-strand DNA-binding protein